MKVPTTPITLSHQNAALQLEKSAKEQLDCLREVLLASIQHDTYRIANAMLADVDASTAIFGHEALQLAKVAMATDLAIEDAYYVYLHDAKNRDKDNKNE